MPIYEYRCAACGRKASIFYRTVAAAEPDPACPRCGERRLARLISRVWSRRGRDAGDVPEPVYEQDGVPFYGADPSAAFDPSGDDEWDVGAAGDDGDLAEVVRETRAMAAMMGEPLEPDLDRALRHIERGADPEEVLGELDDLAGETEADDPP